ncbi:type 11 methyltransferase [Haloferula helveola]|uniref:Type 11 methyltransferase n=1 Tax=Haloferula helveola TaxID=490095 RepID=A0ABM7RGW2_9BACT|nr:type 11 methyltransferase [Haloferula helveola]
MNLYASLEAELHDAFWEAEESPEFGWLDALLREHPGRSLEVGSGSGRLLLPLLKNGHEIEGLEPSPDMNSLCRAKAAILGLNPTLHECAMGDFTTGHTFRSILIPAFTLQLSQDPEADLRRLHRQLEPNGILYLTVFIPFAELDGELPENEWYEDHTLQLADGSVATVETRHRLDRGNQILHREHRYRVVSESETREHRSEQTLRWFDARRLREQLRLAGFEADRAVGDFDESCPVTEDSQILTVVARRI